MALPILSLESRLGLLRRRRRVMFLKQLLGLVGPTMIGATLLLLLALVGAGVRSG
jgi:hypothetical protein